jgi:subtilisin family serine protease
VAKEAWIVPVNVANCGLRDNKGKAYISDQFMIRGINWIIRQKLSHPAQPMVANMSISATTPAIVATVSRAVAAGVHFVTSSGNKGMNICLPGVQDRKRFLDPSKSLVVGATGYLSDYTMAYDRTNFGSCVNIYAPGLAPFMALQRALQGLWLSENSDDGGIGTSFSSPLVAGAVAMFLERNPRALQTQVVTHILRTATPGQINFGNHSSFYDTYSFSNSLLYVGPGFL